MQKQNFSQGGFMPKNRQYYRKVKYPDKVTKPKRLVFVRIFLFCSVRSKITYFPTIPFLISLFCNCFWLMSCYHSMSCDKTHYQSDNRYNCPKLMFFQHIKISFIIEPKHRLDLYYIRR